MLGVLKWADAQFVLHLRMGKMFAWPLFAQELFWEATASQCVALVYSRQRACARAQGLGKNDSEQNSELFQCRPQAQA